MKDVVIKGEMTKKCRYLEDIVNTTKSPDSIIQNTFAKTIKRIKNVKRKNERDILE
jgi:hypothetical protein